MGSDCDKSTSLVQFWKAQAESWKRKYMEALKANGELYRQTPGASIDELKTKPCRQCYYGKADDDGFCSDYCMDGFDNELSGKQTKEEEE